MPYVVQCWDFQREEYVPVEKESVPPLLCNDMNEIVHCINCGHEMKHGDSFCSMRWHNHMGVGYSVCGVCYLAECRERRLRLF